LNDDVSLTGAEVLDPLGRILLHGTTSRDMKVRTDSSKLYFTWLTRRVEAEQREDQDCLPKPEDIERIRDLLQDRQAMDISGVKGMSDLHCPHCGEKFVSPDEADGEG
jgi:hypothetical protein